MDLRYQLVRGKTGALRTPKMPVSLLTQRLVSLPTNFSPPVPSLPVIDVIADKVGSSGFDFSITPIVIGGDANVWTLDSGTLPTGLSLSSSTGEISGVPTVIELQTGIVLKVTDFNSFVDTSNSFQINIIAAAELDEDFDSDWDGT